MVAISLIKKQEFFKPVKNSRKIKETFEDVYDKIEILQQRIKKLEGVK